MRRGKKKVEDNFWIGMALGALLVGLLMVAIDIITDTIPRADDETALSHVAFPDAPEATIDFNELDKRDRQMARKIQELEASNTEIRQHVMIMEQYVDAIIQFLHPSDAGTATADPNSYNLKLL